MPAIEGSTANLYELPRITSLAISSADVIDHDSGTFGRVSLGDSATKGRPGPVQVTVF